MHLSSRSLIYSALLWQLQEAHILPFILDGHQPSSSQGSRALVATRSAAKHLRQRWGSEGDLSGTPTGLHHGRSVSITTEHHSHAVSSCLVLFQA